MKNKQISTLWPYQEFCADVTFYETQKRQMVWLEAATFFIKLVLYVKLCSERSVQCLLTAVVDVEGGGDS